MRIVLVLLLLASCAFAPDVTITWGTDNFPTIAPAPSSEPRRLLPRVRPETSSSRPPWYRETPPLRERYHNPDDGFWLDLG